MFITKKLFIIKRMTAVNGERWCFSCEISGSHGGEYTMAVFWVVAPRSMIDFTDVSEVLAAFITHRPDDGGSKSL
jgi:hypothetical protein